jgi:hypothetical protein
MLEDFKEPPIVDPPATDQALYEMLGLIFRGDAEPPFLNIAGGDSKRANLSSANQRAPTARDIPQRQNRASKRMMGRGMPSSHNNMPLPNPMISSLIFHVP